jgi:hypothetical protein
MKPIIYFLGFVFLIASCSSGGAYKSEEQEAVKDAIENYSSSDQTAMTDDETSVQEEPGNTGQVSPPVSESIVVKEPEKIIKTGSMSLTVAEYDSAIVSIKNIIKSSQGYISNEYESKTSYSISNTLTIRVTSAYFDKLVTGLENSGYNVTSKNIEMQDVTAEFVDIQARLKTKRETEERYREILKQARTIREVLEVESYLKSVREEIESAEGRLKYLNDKVSYSTMTLTIYQESDNPYQPGFGSKMGNAFSGGWDILKGIIIGFFFLWPLWLLAGVTLLIIFRKRLKRKQ